MSSKKKNCRRRIMIGAELTSPGPGRYLLPSLTGTSAHCQSHRREPAFTMGPKLQPKDRDCSPGPKYGIAAGVYRNGKFEIPEVTMGHRTQEKKVFMTPAPNNYPYERQIRPLNYRSVPCYTMSSRRPLPRLDPLPAPNQYNPPIGLGYQIPDLSNVPKYTIAGKGQMKLIELSPGPAQFNLNLTQNVTRRVPPAYTIVHKHNFPDRETRPGPGAHRPEMCTLNYAAAPRVNMHIRHSPYIRHVPDLPDPNDDYW